MKKDQFIQARGIIWIFFHVIRIYMYIHCSKQKVYIYIYIVCNSILLLYISNEWCEIGMHVHTCV